MTNASNTTAARRPLPRVVVAIEENLDELWVGSLAALFVVWGYHWIPRLIRMLGRGGQTETVELAVYISLLAGFPLLSLFIAVVMPRLFRGHAQLVLKASAVLFALWIALGFVFDGRIGIAALALVPAVVVATIQFGFSRFRLNPSIKTVVDYLMLVLVALIAWMCAGTLVSWTRGSTWFMGTPGVALILATALAVFAIQRGGSDGVVSNGRPAVERMLVTAILAALVIFSFRTNPVVEPYHWQFWTGPVEQLRQGGWLLYDTPTQYGVLSLLIPTALPGSAYASLWIFQSLVFAVVGCTMFLVFRRMNGGVASLLLAAALTFTVLYFRPRTASMILPAQMTPSGGPVRFLWTWVPLVWLLAELDLRRCKLGNYNDAKFLMVGHVIWLASLAWSMEAGIYCTGIWFSAFSVFLIQRARVQRENGKNLAFVVRRGLISFATPIGLAISLYALVTLIWLAFRGVTPDLMSYIEYGFLYTSGYASLPVHTSGAVWYLVLVFSVVSTIAIALVAENWRDFRLVVVAGAWGGIWAISSYFVARSHPVNLLSILPVVLFALATVIVATVELRGRRWHQLMRVAIVPVFAVPIALTLGHPLLLANLSTPQVSPARLPDQIPPMKPELQNLMIEAGAKPSDPVVYTVDGRFTLPAWKAADGSHVMSPRSWLAKPYEILSSLPAHRRQAYITREAALGISGWLVLSEKHPLPADQLQQILATHAPQRKSTRGDWTVWWMVPRR